MWTQNNFELIQIPVLQDNFIYIGHDKRENKTWVVDPAEAAPVMAVLRERGWKLDLILNTHHHADHTGGNKELIAAYGCAVYASDYDKNRIPGITRSVAEGESFSLGQARFEVIATPGHTLGHIIYWFPENRWLFCGDTLFSLGCGRLFEGKAADMWPSLKKIRALPDEALVFCTHEYTLSNARFAESLPWQPQEQKDFIETCRELRSVGKFTVPSRLADEKAFNPFLQADNPAMQKALGMEKADATAVFAEIRSRKDHF